MNFKVGDIVVVERFFNGDPKNEYINRISEIKRMADRDLRKCIYNKCKIRTEECNDRTTPILLKDFYCWFCKEELRYATDREKFLYYTHGPMALRGGEKNV